MKAFITKFITKSIAILLALMICGNINAMQSVNQELNNKLLLAAKTGDTASVKNLLRQGASIFARDSQGYTPLHLAAMQGKKDVAILLLNAGACAKDNFNATGISALDAAKNAGHLDIVQAIYNARPGIMSSGMGNYRGMGRGRRGYTLPT